MVFNENVAISHMLFVDITRSIWILRQLRFSKEASVTVDILTYFKPDLTTFLGGSNTSKIFPSPSPLPPKCVTFSVKDTVLFHAASWDLAVPLHLTRRHLRS